MKNYVDYDGFMMNEDCHKLTEIVPGLFLGSKSQVELAVENQTFDVLYPLDSLDGSIWDNIDPKYTRIKYCPIKDYSFLHSKVLDWIVEEILTDLQDKKKVALFCFGGHGRTGYIASCILSRYGFRDPVKKLHDSYCVCAVESLSQMKSIVLYMERHNLDAKPMKKRLRRMRKQEKERRELYELSKRLFDPYDFPDSD